MIIKNNSPLYQKRYFSWRVSSCKRI